MVLIDSSTLLLELLSEATLPMLTLTDKRLESLLESALFLSVLRFTVLQVLCELLAFLRQSALQLLRPAGLLRQLLCQTAETVLNGFRDSRLLFAQE